MSDKDLSWKFAEEFPVEPAATQTARQHSLELGIEPVSPAVGAQLAVLAAATDAKSILEIGTGAGVSGLWLLQGAPAATLTTIDVEIDHQNRARQAYTDAGIAAARARLIAGRATDVLPRMNDGAYDLVLVDADPASVLDYVEHGLRIARRGGVVAVAHALWRGRVADPAQRDETVADFRALLATIAESSAVTAALSVAGDGLLQLVKTGD
ncbi:O-methyltransferase [Protaetiibacter intestinalis]|uniref:Methyltransferase n=1 Tax=Protaetiibacter intestinalis TaxID=2419774 RepID=A0A387BBN5_9MICO|nr:class I SAM-dependent methyltransferase [Protaetiibacter intestinalis]AYF98505.1 methyltransferase [Protaetiibacter intestinalis]